MFASWSAGEYGNIGATEWLEVTIKLLYVHKGKQISTVLKMVSNVLILF